MAEEENFPRGGKLVRKRPPQDTDTLFNVLKPPKAKKQKKTKKRDLPEPSEAILGSAIHVKGSLTYRQIQTGMVILGCVRSISSFGLEIELPGLCSVLVTVTEISDPFTKHLSQQLENGASEANAILSNMFSVGEFLPVKILSIEPRDNKTHVEGSINPRELYSEHNHNSFKKHMLVWSCINSKADHGYEMSLGVKNCRAFLPFKNIAEEVDVGKPFWCVVHRADNTASTSTLRLSARTEHIKSSKPEIESLDNVIPGIQVDFVVDEVRDHGIQGKFSENFLGYVDENFLSKPLKKLSEYQEGKLLSAWLLFVEPTTKIAHLSLRYPEKEAQPELNIGDIVQAKVFSKSNSGLYFSLPNHLKGFTANRRLIKSLAQKDNMNIIEAVKAKFPIGSSHKCRILDYNHMCKLFVCTPESSVVHDSAFAPSDLSPGQLIEVRIVEIKPEGMLVTTGHIRGFVTNMHISNIEFTENVKKKFKEGQKIQARVLSVEGRNVLFTLKPSLVENDECLSKIEDAEIGKKYPGLVCQISESGALIVFYGNVKGWISLKGMGSQATDPSKYFFIGQVVSVYVWRIEKPKMYLSLFRPQVKSSSPNVGGRYVGIVKSIQEDGVRIQIENTKGKGFVPNAHLTCCLSLCRAIKNTFKPGDKIANLMYVGGEKPQVFSRREGMALKARSVPCLKDLKVGAIIRCSYQSSTDKGVCVLPLIYDYSEMVLVPLKERPELVQHQLLMAKIVKLDAKSREISLSVKLSDVFDGTVESSISLFTQYLSELSYLHRHCKAQKWDIYKFKAGDRAMCKIEKLGPQGGCIVTLPNGAKGIAAPSLCPKNLQEGDEIQGTVIAHDYEKRFVDVCLKPDLSGRINPLQNGIVEKVASCQAEILLAKDDWSICVLKHSEGNKQLVYLPARVHPNDFRGCSSYYDKKKLKICVCGKAKKHLIGLSKQLFLQLDKPNRLKSKENGLAEEKAPTSDCDSGIEHEETDTEVETEQIAPSKSVALPGVSSFFEAPKKDTKDVESSSEDEDSGPTVKKKKKLTPAERAELLRQEEARISKIEQELADPNKPPESAEQFDRLLLSKPDCAELWAKYIAFHIAATEIDKARAVASRALDTINMTLTEEKFKIWVVLLNLENMFGTKESFDTTLKDALKFNDSLQVYLKVINMFAESAKHGEMEDMINKVRIKHKQDPVMWMEVAKTYYLIGNFKSARSCKDRALKSIADKKSQMNLIVRFAILEFKYGEPDQGCAIFETILTSDPKKVNVWITYVDQLVKKDSIEEARQVLERSVCLNLPLKSMKSLFMKFRKFEETHGSPESVEAVKQRAQDYVKRFGK